jgi:hypothetical protein
MRPAQPIASTSHAIPVWVIYHTMISIRFEAMVNGVNVWLGIIVSTTLIDNLGH